MWFVKLLIVGAVTYLLVLAEGFFLQTALLFPARLAAASGPLPAGARHLALGMPDGERIHGLHIPPTRSSEGDRLVILGFGGNAWNADHVAAYLHGLYPEADVVAFHYRGYGPSGGSPSAETLLADAPLLPDFIVKSVEPDRIVAVGYSIGSGIAAHLASRRTLDGLILVTPFDSLAALARGHYPWLPTGLLLRHRMAPVEDLARVTAPVALIAGARDTLIPSTRTAALREAVPNLVLDRTIAGAGHNDIYDRPAFREAMTEALRRMKPPSAKP